MTTQANQAETYGLRELVFDDFLPTALEFYRVGKNPNQVVDPADQNRVYTFQPQPTRTDDPNSQLLYGVSLSPMQWTGLAVAAALTAYLIFK